MKKRPKFFFKSQRPYNFKLTVRSEKQAEEVKAFFCKALSRLCGMSCPITLELTFPKKIADHIWSFEEIVSPQARLGKNYRI